MDFSPSEGVLGSLLSYDEWLEENVENRQTNESESISSRLRSRQPRDSSGKPSPKNSKGTHNEPSYSSSRSVAYEESPNVYDLVKNKMNTRRTSSYTQSNLKNKTYGSNTVNTFSSNTTSSNSNRERNYINDKYTNSYRNFAVNREAELERMSTVDSLTVHPNVNGHVDYVSPRDNDDKYSLLLQKIRQRGFEPKTLGDVLKSRKKEWAKTQCIHTSAKEDFLRHLKMYKNQFRSYDKTADGWVCRNYEANKSENNGDVDGNNLNGGSSRTKYGSSKDLNRSTGYKDYIDGNYYYYKDKEHKSKKKDKDLERKNKEKDRRDPRDKYLDENTVDRSKEGLVWSSIIFCPNFRPGGEIIHRFSKKTTKMYNTLYNTIKNGWVHPNLLVCLIRDATHPVRFATPPNQDCYTAIYTGPEISENQNSRVIFGEYTGIVYREDSIPDSIFEYAFELNFTSASWVDAELEYRNDKQYIRDMNGTIFLPNNSKYVLDSSNAFNELSMVNHCQSIGAYGGEYFLQANCEWQQVIFDGWPHVILTNKQGVKIQTGDELIADFGALWFQKVEENCHRQLKKELIQYRLTNSNDYNSFCKNYKDEVNMDCVRSEEDRDTNTTSSNSSHRDKENKDKNEMGTNQTDYQSGNDVEVIDVDADELVVDVSSTTSALGTNSNNNKEHKSKKKDKDLENNANMDGNTGSRSKNVMNKTQECGDKAGTVGSTRNTTHSGFKFLESEAHRKRRFELLRQELPVDKNLDNLDYCVVNNNTSYVCAICLDEDLNNNPNTSTKKLLLQRPSMFNKHNDSENNVYRDDDDEDECIVCDGCDRIFHTKCLQDVTDTALNYIQMDVYGARYINLNSHSNRQTKITGVGNANRPTEMDEDQCSSLDVIPFLSKNNKLDLSLRKWYCMYCRYLCKQIIQHDMNQDFMPLQSCIYITGKEKNEADGHDDTTLTNSGSVSSLEMNSTDDNENYADNTNTTTSKSTKHRDSDLMNLDEYNQTSSNTASNNRDSNSSSTNKTTNTTQNNNIRDYKVREWEHKEVIDVDADDYNNSNRDNSNGDSSNNNTYGCENNSNDNNNNRDNEDGNDSYSRYMSGDSCESADSDHKLINLNKITNYISKLTNFNISEHNLDDSPVNNYDTKDSTTSNSNKDNTTTSTISNNSNVDTTNTSTISNRDQYSKYDDSDDNTNRDNNEEEEDYDEYDNTTRNSTKDGRDPRDKYLDENTDVELNHVDNENYNYNENENETYLNTRDERGDREYRNYYRENMEYKVRKKSKTSSRRDYPNSAYFKRKRKRRSHSLRKESMFKGNRMSNLFRMKSVNKPTTFQIAKHLIRQKILSLNSNRASVGHIRLFGNYTSIASKDYRNNIKNRNIFKINLFNLGLIEHTVHKKYSNSNSNSNMESVVSSSESKEVNDLNYGKKDNVDVSKFNEVIDVDADELVVDVSNTASALGTSTSSNKENKDNGNSNSSSTGVASTTTQNNSSRDNTSTSNRDRDKEHKTKRKDSKTRRRNENEDVDSKDSNNTTTSSNRDRDNMNDSTGVTNLIEYRSQNENTNFDSEVNDEYDNSTDLKNDTSVVTNVVDYLNCRYLAGMWQLEPFAMFGEAVRVCVDCNRKCGPKANVYVCRILKRHLAGNFDHPKATNAEQMRELVLIAYEQHVSFLLRLLVLKNVTIDFLVKLVLHFISHPFYQNRTPNRNLNSRNSSRDNTSTSNSSNRDSSNNSMNSKSGIGSGTPYSNKVSNLSSSVSSSSRVNLTTPMNRNTTSTSSSNRDSNSSSTDKASTTTQNTNSNTSSNSRDKNSGEDSNLSEYDYYFGTSVLRNGKRRSSRHLESVESNKSDSDWEVNESALIELSPNTLNSLNSSAKANSSGVGLTISNYGSLNSSTSNVNNVGSSTPQLDSVNKDKKLNLNSSGYSTYDAASDFVKSEINRLRKKDKRKERNKERLTLQVTEFVRAITCNMKRVPLGDGPFNFALLETLGGLEKDFVRLVNCGDICSYINDLASYMCFSTDQVPSNIQQILSKEEIIRFTHFRKHLLKEPGFFNPVPPGLYSNSYFNNYYNSNFNMNVGYRNRDFMSKDLESDREYYDSRDKDNKYSSRNINSSNKEDKDNTELKDSRSSRGKDKEHKSKKKDKDLERENKEREKAKRKYEERLIDEDANFIPLLGIRPGRSILYRKFSDGYYQGLVSNYGNYNYFKIEYSDGDDELMDPMELLNELIVNLNNVKSILLQLSSNDIRNYQYLLLLRSHNTSSAAGKEKLEQLCSELKTHMLNQLVHSRLYSGKKNKKK